jgi:broad specificity phosphatase PhoE
MSRLLLVRHGQSTWNAEERWQGHADPPLSDLGERQARAAAPSVVALDATAVVSSDLTRAWQTAELLAPPALTPVVEPSVRERDVGEWTGLTTTEIDEQFPDFRVEHRSPPGFEGDEPLLARVLPALDAVIERYGADAVVVVVTHGGVIRTVERHLGATPAGVPNLGGRWLHASDGGLAIGARELLIDPHDTVVTIGEEL